MGVVLGVVLLAGVVRASWESWEALSNIDVGNNPGGDTPPSPEAVKLQQHLDAAAAEGPGAVVTIAAGDYRFGNSSLFLDSAIGVSVVADAGATLWFNYTQGFILQNCENVSVSGITIDYDPPCFAQGVVTAVGPDAQQGLNASQFEAQFDARFIFPDPSVSLPFVSPGGLSGPKVGFWDPSTLRQIYQGNQFMSRSDRLNTTAAAGESTTTTATETEAAATASPTFAAYDAVVRGSNAVSGPVNTAAVVAGLNTGYRITLRSPLKGNPTVNKTLVAVWPRGGSTYLLRNSTRVTTHNLTVHGGGNMGVIEDHGGGGHVHTGLAIVRRSTGPVHLLALNADGFHSNTAENAPMLLDSEISHTGDDHYNCHSRMLVTLERLDNGSAAYIIETDDGITLGRVAQNKHLGGECVCVCAALFLCFERTSSTPWMCKYFGHSHLLCVCASQHELSSTALCFSNVVGIHACSSTT